MWLNRTMEHTTISYVIDCPDKPKNIEMGVAYEHCAVIHTAYRCSCGLEENHEVEHLTEIVPANE
jgi:hypothetical protein